ncbi:MAG: hypothetical protein Q9166_006484 [cf. Caloplaca sp. 2 TL-2023]
MALTISNNNTLSTLNPGTHCRNHDPQWDPDEMLMEHCTTALHGFYNTQVRPSADRDYEFLAYNAMPMYKPVQQVAITPRKYEVGSCVLAIAMVSFYDPAILHERGLGPFLDNDVTKFGKIWRLCVGEVLGYGSSDA